MKPNKRIVMMLALLLGMMSAAPDVMAERAKRARAAPVVAQETEKKPEAWLREGAEQLRRGEVKPALEAWRKFLEQAQCHPRLEDVRGYVTLLRRLDAQQAARRMARQEAAAHVPPGRGERILAIFPLENVVHTTKLGPKKPFNQAVLAWITADLLKVPGLKIVERQYMRALLDELALASSDLADADNRVRVGRMLGASEVVHGVVEDYDDDNYDEGEYEVATAIARVGDGGVVGTQEAEGPRLHFVEILKEIEYEILEDLGITDIPPEVGKAHTRDWAAYAEFAVGLEQLDQGRFDEARAAFSRALSFDPAFDLAQEALSETPGRSLTPEEMAQRLTGSP